MLITPITYNTKTNISHKGFAQDVKKLSLFATDHRLSLLEKKEIRGIDKPKNLKLVDELFKVFEGCFGSDIYRAYYAILDSNDEVNNYAKSALYALASGKSTSILTNLKNIGKQGSKSYKLGLDHIADLVQACKDDNGNHHKKALDLLGELETETLDPIKIPTYIEFCKDNNGQINNEKVKLLKDFISKDYHIHAGIIAQLPVENTRAITPDRLEFFNHVMEKYKKKEVKSDALNFAQEILEITKDGDKNISELRIIDLNFDKLLNEDKTVKWTAEYFRNNDGFIPFFNVQYMFHEIIPKAKALGKNMTLPPELFKKNNGCIVKANITQAFRLLNTYHYSDSEISELLKLKEMKDSNGEIDEKFINLILDNIFYFRETEYTPYPIEILKEVLRIVKNSDGTTNWKVANNIIKPIYLLFKNKGQEMYKLGIKYRPENSEHSSYFDTYKYCSLLEKSIKGVNGKFSKERIEEFSKIKDCESLINTITGKPLDKMIEDKNLYKAEDLLEILRELKKTNRLTPAYLNASIKDYDSLFWTIIDAPKTKENKEAYSEMIKLLSGVDSKFKKGAEKLNFNQKDKNGISVLEKVINAENEELLDVIIKNSDELYYYPELDWAFEGVQNPKFKEKLKHLDLKFKDLEQSAKLCSVKTFDRLKSQLDSPLCNKEKVIARLFDILKEQKGTVAPPDVYAFHLLEEYGINISKNLFDEMASWQIAERTKRIMQ